MTSVIGPAVCQVVFYLQLGHSSDLSLDSWKLVICTQLMQSVSITTACIPQFRPFLDSLESGLIRSDDFRRRGMTWKYGNGDSHLASSTSKKKYFLSSNIFTTTEAEAPDEFQLQLVNDPTSSLCQVQANPRQFSGEEGLCEARILKSTTWSVAEHNKA